jgi:hypothetical protein
VPSSSSPIPSRPSRELPTADLGPLRFSRAARESVDGAIKGAYGLGAADGFAVGQAVGQVEGHVAGLVEGSVLTAVAFGIVFFVACVLMRATRK